MEQKNISSLPFDALCYCCFTDISAMERFKKTLNTEEQNLLKVKLYDHIPQYFQNITYRPSSN